MGRCGLFAKPLDSGGATLNSDVYTYDLAGRRTFQTLPFTNYFNYTYDNAGQLKAAIGYESNRTNRLQEQLGYAYD
jgi:hypothetical protein